MTAVRAGCAGIATAWIIVVGFIGLIVATSAAFWWFGVKTSDVRGRGEQTKQVNSAVNRTDWYHHFFDLKTAYEGQVQAVGLAKQQLDDFNKANPPGTADPAGQIAELRAQDQTNLTGVRQACIDSATKYNNDSLKTTIGAQFKAAGLPDTLDVHACETK